MPAVVEFLHENFIHPLNAFHGELFYLFDDILRPLHSSGTFLAQVGSTFVVAILMNIPLFLFAACFLLFLNGGESPFPVEEKKQKDGEGKRDVDVDEKKEGEPASASTTTPPSPSPSPSSSPPSSLPASGSSSFLSKLKFWNIFKKPFLVKAKCVTVGSPSSSSSSSSSETVMRALWLKEKSVDELRRSLLEKLNLPLSSGPSLSFMTSDQTLIEDNNDVALLKYGDTVLVHIPHVEKENEVEEKQIPTERRKDM